MGWVIGALLSILGSVASNLGVNIQVRVRIDRHQLARIPPGAAYSLSPKSAGMQQCFPTLPIHISSVRLLFTRFA
jgi:hypothetical protein